MEKETTPKQNIALAGKKFASKKRPAGAVARKKHQSSQVALLAPWRLLGNPPLLRGEKAEDFRRFLLDAVKEHRPSTQHQRLLVWDIAVITWQIERLRRIDVGLLDVPTQSEIKPDFTGLFPTRRIPGTPCFAPPEPVPPRKELPAQAPITMQDMARAFTQNVDAIERNQKLISVHERRRDALFRELERLQSSPGPQAPEPVTLDLPSQEIDS